MSIFLSVNDIVMNSEDNSGKTERILWMDDYRVMVYVIDIFTSNGMPELKKIYDIESALEAGQAELLKSDPLMRMIPEEDIKERDKLLRDNIWEIVSPILIPQNEPDIYLRDKRGLMIKQIIMHSQISQVAVYKYLRRYWQRGKNKNAFLPDYDHCGGKGKPKALGGIKTGRPRKNAFAIGEGINVSDSTKKVFEMAVNRFYHNEKENTFVTAYELMVKEFYTRPQIADDGTERLVLLPSDQIPTIRQFRYWYEKEGDIKKALKSRKGLKNYELNHRAILGKSDYGITGPGAKYQIDATVGDIYLVSRFNRNWIIGRPVVYFVIDVFSRMIVGIYVGLEGPSWIGAMMALANATSDKVKFCKEYDLEITENDWPSHHMPEAILADRGEMEGKMVETLINSLYVRVENTPPYRADWKGIVEQYFRTMNMNVKPFVPGFVNTEIKQRGGKDYRLDAKIDIFQFAQIIIKCVLYHNNEHWLNDYDMDADMLSDQLNPIPKEIWNWGIVNRSGRLRTFPEDIIKLNLMPYDKATVTARGIKFKQLFYFCKTALQDMWFEKARNKGSWKVNISYDPRNMGKIYLRIDNGRDYEECFLFDWQEKYINKSMDEINYLFDVEKLEKQKKAGSIMQSKTDLNSDIEKIVAQAQELSNQACNDDSKSKRIKGIRDNRKNEKIENRKNEAFYLGDELNRQHDQVSTGIVNEEEDMSYQDTLDLIEKKLEERLRAQQKP